MNQLDKLLKALNFDPNVKPCFTITTTDRLAFPIANMSNKDSAILERIADEHNRVIQKEDSGNQFISGILAAVYVFAIDKEPVTTIVKHSGDGPLIMVDVANVWDNDRKKYYHKISSIQCYDKATDFLPDGINLDDKSGHDYDFAVFAYDGPDGKIVNLIDYVFLLFTDVGLFADGIKDFIDIVIEFIIEKLKEE